MKSIILIAGMACMLLLAPHAEAQRYATKDGRITFFSEAPAENIEAFNNQVNSALDVSTGGFIFRVLMKSFQFEKALMQEHFNENYMESHKFPNATFQGKITNLSEMNFAKDGTYNANIEGKLTIHGVTKDIAEKGTFTVKDGVVQGFSKFNVKVADYEIKIPGAVVNNIAESIEVTVDVKLEGI